MSEHLFPYRWNIADGYPAKGIEKHGAKVFGTFICGGGSSMGYKLAGYEHLGGVEIDPQVADIYKANHDPKYLFVEDIRSFNERKDLPAELYDLDLLDGSPPCSTFSMAGSREKAWGKEKHFREGQTAQTLDDLVFVYCETIKKLKPKVFILENVKGIIQGNAKAYSKQIVKTMTDAGYTVQVFLLNAASMGVPQKRERVFFIGYRKEFSFDKLRLDFREKGILFGEFYQELKDDRPLGFGKMYDYWLQRLRGDESFCDTIKRTEGASRCFSIKYLYQDMVCMTYTSNSDVIYLFDEYRRPNKNESCCIGTYPQDYDFLGLAYNYLIGMSVPPVMTAQIANQIYLQWLSKL